MKRRALRFIVGAIGCVLVGAWPSVAVAQVDFAGEWQVLMHEDQPERAAGPEIGNYVGLPINSAARLRGETWNASLLTVPEHQCIPHPANYMANHGNLRMWKEVDDASQQLIAWHLLSESYNRFRTIYMDGRPHPSDDAPHTWQGFSTGEWRGGMLVVTTTHLKAARISRNGIEHSDRARLTEFIARHGDILTIGSWLDDPVYLTEPFFYTRNFRLNLNQVIRPYPCRGVVEVERADGEVPSYMPGKNPFLDSFAKKFGLPLEAAMGGAETMYPEYAKAMRAMRPVATDATARSR
jgi:hypothetical protein